MHPQLFGVVQTYAVCLVLADLVGVTLAFWCARRAKVNLPRFALGLVGLTLSAIAGGKIYGLIERGGALGALRAEVFSGYRYPGAVVGVSLMAVTLGRVRWFGVSAGKLADVVAPSFGFAMAVVRVGCLLAGCCAGTVSNVPWAVRFPARSQVWHSHVQAGFLSSEAPFSLAVHPLQVYFGVVSLSLGLFALGMEPRKRYEGQVFLAYVTLYAGSQFLLEFLRLRALPHVQYLSAALALFAGTILIFKGLRVRRGSERGLRDLSRNVRVWALCQLRPFMPAIRDRSRAPRRVARLAGAAAVRQKACRPTATS